MKRSGFTAIELVVTILVTAAFAAVTVPAVRSAKDAENKQKCQAKLKVLGEAIAAEVKDHGGFGCTIGTEFVSLFPYIGQQAVYDKWFANGGLWDRQLTKQQQIDKHNRFVTSKTTIPEFLCPSHIDDRTVLSMNYLWNAGIGPGDPDSGVIIPEIVAPRKMADFTDGLSNSVVMSETRWVSSKKVSLLKYDPDDLGAVHKLADTDITKPKFWEQFLRDCRVGRNIVGGHPNKGRGWHEIGNTMSQYHHVFEPFQRSCHTGGFDWGHATASSYHDNGVNVLLADGSVRYVNRFIDLQLWQNLGNRCDGEKIEW